ncbi:MAG: hypothetical protein JST08_03250 [Actinobacteria bacterium]|nr:hypothetical protein [Actinomycetota bacterium]
MAEGGLPIWTLEARDSVMLEVVSSLFNLSPEQMRREIKAMHETTVAAIAAKGIEYGELGNALTPQRTRRERAFLFDTARIEAGAYGYAVAEVILPLLPPDLSCSIRHGDLVLEPHLQDRGVELLNTEANLIRRVDLVDTNQIYCVYLNNLTARMVTDITDGLSDYDPFVGYVEASTSSSMKDWLSTTLVNAYLKHRRAMLNGHEDDAPNTVNYNLPGWPVEDNGYQCLSNQDMYFHLFLGYKIERRVVPGAEGDTDFSLTAISGNPLPLADFDIEVDSAKAEYLRQHHPGGLERAGLLALSNDELAAAVKAKVSDSYIYKLRYLDEHDTSLFDLMVELESRDEEGSARKTRLLASLAYEPSRRVLRLVTLF